MRATARHIAVFAVCLAGSVLAGCLGGDEGTKAGGTSGPVTLRVGTDDPAARPGSDQLEEFARRVEKLSGGALRIESVLNAGGDGSDWDQRVARMVASGKLDMGLIPTRAFDTEGVTSMRALNAPFLITSNELLAEIVSGELVDDLMSSLDEAGVVGIALLPEGLRHPFGFKAPLLGPEDYAGEGIRTPTSNTTSAVFEALGATPNDREPNAGTQAGMESAYAQEPAGTATGNVTFYPKANALVANDDVLEDLDESQREILERAAAQTREWAIESTPDEAQAAQAYCEDGGAVVLASEADVAALEEATVPVYAELEGDKQTKSLIEAIRELEEEIAVSATAPAGCGETGAGAGAEPTATPISRFDGVYRFEITDKQLRDVGVTDQLDLDENHGVYTVTLSGGEYCWEQRAPNPLNNPDECSTYERDGKRVIWNFPVGEPDVYRFRKTARGDLELTVVGAGPGELPYARAWAANTWILVGDAD